MATGGGALGNLAAMLIGRAWQLRGDLGAAIVAGTGRRCLRQLSGHTHRAGAGAAAMRGISARPLSPVLGAVP